MKSDTIDEGVTPMDCGVRNSKARYYLLGGNLQFATFDVASGHEAIRIGAKYSRKIMHHSIVDVTERQYQVEEKNNASDDIRNCFSKLMQTQDVSDKIKRYI